MDKFLTPEEFNVDNVFKGKYNIPIYQRPYSWNRDQVSILLKDIEQSYKIYKNSSVHQGNTANEEMLLFTGTLFIKINRNVKNSYTEYDVVDGQQRITTLTLMLMVLLNHFYLIKSEDDSVKEIENYLWKKTDRRREKDQRVLTLGNIDKQIMESLFDTLFAQNNIIEFAEKKTSSIINDVEENLLLNLQYIDNYYNGFFSSNEEYYEYFDYIKSNIRFIAIEVHTNLVKLFSIFESINSKGKPLEDIDLFKSYIFQNINENDYDEYLTKWGNLIEETQDNLMDYFTIYVRANISYYRNSIKLANFKNLVDGAFSEYYQTSSTRDTMVNLIDDMLDNVKYYKMLTNDELLLNSGVSKKAIVYFMMNRIAEYNHDKALFYKLLILLDKNKLEQNVFESIVENAFKFILTFQSVCSRESKTTLSIFVDVQSEIYKVISHFNDKTDLSSTDFASIVNIFNKNILNNAINDDTLRRNIKTNLTYNNNKKAVKVILSFLEYQDANGNVDYTKLYWLLKARKDIQIDHILPLSPKKDDANFKYFIDGESIILKNGQDFASYSNSTSLSKDDFYETYLHVIGNLRLEWANENIKKSNHLIIIKEYDSSFNTNSQISTRSLSLISQILSSGLLYSATSIKTTGANNDALNDIIELTSFDKNMKYELYKPISFEFLGEKYLLEKSNYSQLLVTFLRIMYNLGSEKFLSLAESKYKPMISDRVYISQDINDIRKPIALSDSIYAEANLSSEYIIKFIYALINVFELNANDMIICLNKTK